MAKKTYVVISMSECINDSTMVLYAGNSRKKALSTFEGNKLTQLNSWDIKVEKYDWFTTCEKRAKLLRKEDGSHIYTVELHVK